MVFQRFVSRFPGRTRIYNSNCHPSIKFPDRSSNPFSQITQKRDLFSGSSWSYGGPPCVRHNAMPTFLGMKSLASFIHSVVPKEVEKGTDDGNVETENNSGFSEDSSRRSGDTWRNAAYLEGLSKRLTDVDRTRGPIETGDINRRQPPGRNAAFSEVWSRRLSDMDRNESSRNGRSMNFIRGIMKDNTSDMMGGGSFQEYRSGVEQNADIVHVKLMRNNTFVTVTDSKGNKKFGASAGCLAEMKGGPKVSKYAAEATAEHVGRVARSVGLKSVVMKVNGFTFFKRKKLAVLSFRDGYTHSRPDRNPIVYVEDTTRKPHNGCRLKKQRRV